MELQLQRLYRKDGYTVGKLFIDGAYFCDTLEDQVRDLTKEEKVYGETAIPPGRYKVTLRYSPRFKRKLPYLHDVPGFQWILIHAGNSAVDTHGCILVGINKMPGRLYQSRIHENKLVALIEQAKEETYFEIA